MGTVKASGLGDLIEKQVMYAIGAAIDIKMKEIIKDATTELEEAMKEEVDKVVLNVLTQYTVERHATELVIRVKKDFTDA